MSLDMRPAPRLADNLHDHVEARLADAGQRYTDGRRQLVEALRRVDRPLTMYDILTHVTDMPQSSAYRHLTVLASSGVVHRLAGTDDSGHYELTDELSGRHHHHVTCATCGTVADIDASSKLERALEQAAALAASETGFVIDSHRIDLVGTCRNCR